MLLDSNELNIRWCLVERAAQSFTDLEIIKKIKSMDHILLKIDKIIDWCEINKILSPIDFRNTSHYGRDCYSPETMYRMFLIQKYYDLSDRELEFQVSTNILFSYFCKISFGNPVPDHTTIKRWRDRFIKHDVFEKLLTDFNNQLAAKGYAIRAGSIIDATFVNSQARPRRKEIIDVEPIGDEEYNDEEATQSDANISYTKEESLDHEARWSAKGKSFYYGYKNTAIVNMEGLFNCVLTTPANIPDCNLLGLAVEKAHLIPGSSLDGDKGYPSEKNSEILINHQIENKIMNKKKPNPQNKLEITQYNEAVTTRNKIISQTRFVIERTWGYAKLKLGLARSRYRGLLKTHNSNVLTALVYNCVRSVNLQFSG